jgi:hypothetical protein
MVPLMVKWIWDTRWLLFRNRWIDVQVLFDIRVFENFWMGIDLYHILNRFLVRQVLHQHTHTYKVVLDTSEDSILNDM